MIELLAPLADLLQIAHETQMPHKEPVKDAGGGTSVVVIAAGIVVSLALVAGLVWLKKRVDSESTIPGEG